MRRTLFAVLAVMSGCTTSGSSDSGTEHDAGFDAGIRPPYPYDGGPIVITDFINDMEPNSWREIPASEMATVSPAVNHYPFEAVVTAWGGGAYDSVNDRMIIFGGGHADSFVNNVFAFDLGPAKWVRFSEMPAALNTMDNPTGAYADKRLETCGLYPREDVTTLNIPDEWLTPSGYVMKERCEEPSIIAQMDDQQPRSTHTYGNVAFSPTTKRFYNLGSSAGYPSAQATSNRTSAFDFETRTWSRKADNVHIAIGGASATDGRGHIFYLSQYDASEYDPVADTWASLPSGADTQSYYSGAAVDTKRDRLVLTSDGQNIQTFNLGEAGKPRIASVTQGLSAPISSALAFEYDSKRDRYFAWAGGRTMYWLNPDTATWTTTTATNEDPGGMPVNGCFGKLRYSKTYDVFVLIRAANAKVILYKPPLAAP
jgi:hypothetical protein